MEAWEEMPIFLELIIVLLCILIVAKNTLVLSEGPTQGLHNATKTAEAKYPINFIESVEGFALSVHYNGSDSFLFVNAMKLYQFKLKDSEIKAYSLCLRNISNNFLLDNLKDRIKKNCKSFFC